MTNKKLTAALAAAALILGASAYAEETKTAPEKEQVKPQTNCPVMGGKINKNLYVDANGKRIYVCCGGCIGKVKADPEKYIKKLEDEGITLEKTPKKEEPKAKNKNQENQ